jgi:bifunctional DNA-binding transcriptional regulator/antitoxin component of YhaV-PrlF toxin-antitoxin module
MRLQKQVSRVVGDSEYVKWVVVVPTSEIEKLGWMEGQELESVVERKKLVIKPQKKSPNKPQKMTYKEFRDSIAGVLKSSPKGLSWTEIKEKLELPQKVPNNLWVRTMETDVGLLRALDQGSGKTIWRLKSQ